MPRSRAPLRCVQQGGCCSCSPAKATVCGLLALVGLQTGIFFFGYVYPGDKGVNTPVGIMFAVLWFVFWAGIGGYYLVRSLSGGNQRGGLRR